MKCDAPRNNMYFTVKGEVSPCWLTVGAVDNWSPKRSISDIWFGEHFAAFNSDTSETCKTCQTNRTNGVWSLADVYDKFPVQKYPSLIELELSNQCNLECLMCSGLLSSGIRKHRDKLPPLPMIYSSQFVNELREFIPHLTELRINGGEPFAQKIVLDICDMVAEIAPHLKITIATNGTVYNSRVKHILENNNIHLNISIDSLTPALYEQIRVNGDFELLMKNFEIFNKYCKENDRSLCVMVNPMCNNWFEMASFVRWTHEHDVGLHFNTIIYPAWMAIHNKSAEWMTFVLYLMKLQIDNPRNKRGTSLKNYPRNLSKFLGLIRQIENWRLDALVDDV